LRVTVKRGDNSRTVASSARRPALLFLYVIYAVLWVGGVLQHWLAGGAATEGRWLASIFLLLAGAIVLLGARAVRDRLLLLAVALSGFAAEVAGVHLGIPFGAYHYTEALGPRLLGVPFVMAFAWMSLAAYVRQMLLRFRLAGWLETIVGATWITAVDLLIDPLAANQLDYWRWREKGFYYGVPLTNFAGWFIVGLLAFRILRGKFGPNPHASLIGLSLILFFTLIALGLHSGLVALFGCALCLIHILFKTRHSV
jgi:bisanhydrobacterioruberin hydratase